MQDEHTRSQEVWVAENLKRASAGRHTTCPILTHIAAGIFQLTLNQPPEPSPIRALIRAICVDPR
jgi:hypothetical protein